MTMRRVPTIALLLAGCSFLSRSKPPQTFSLDRIPPAAPVAHPPGVPIGIDVLELPPGLDRREVVTRQADHRLDVRGGDQWSASLRPLVLHTLAFDLAARLPEGMVVLPGESKPLAMRSIDVMFEELAAGPDNAVLLDARWIVRETGRPEVAHHERITVTVPSLASADVAAGISRAVAELADRIVSGT